ncbi:MAG: right-handed parallel beta-helix repeat-containing protein [Acidobacteria bacterium]|nr:right-handed parallel beta-helix repeat-containing protein [Acidobacteriota bacterium]
MSNVARILLAVVLVAIAVLSASPQAMAQCGPRYVAASGSTDTGNNCLSAATPCATINHAISVACPNDAIQVGEGTYVEDVLVDRALFVNSSGDNAQTILRGTGATDSVRILESGTTLNGFAVSGPTGHACVRIGDAAHPGVRSIQISNDNISGCTVGVVVDSVGTTGDWVRINGNIIANHVADGTPDGGTGVLIVGGAGRVEVRQDNIQNNEGAGVKLLAGANDTLYVAANTMTGNGRGALATGRAAIEAHGAVDLRVEGNYVTGHTGVAGDDGRGLLIDGIDGGQVVCNQFRDNDSGLEVAGVVDELQVLHNRFAAQTGNAVLVQPGSAAGTHVNETLFVGNATAVRNLDPTPLDARHCWWGSADGPSGAGGSGDPVVGPLDLSEMVARALEPVLARAPAVGGWSHGAGAACYDTLQPAIDANPTGGLILVGKGELRGHATITRPMALEGLPGFVLYEWCGGCRPSVIDGTQLSGARTPALTISNVSGVHLKNLTFHGAGMGSPQCFGGHEDSEIGLDLQNVKNSLFEFLDFRENGTTDLRLFGDSDDNVIDGIYLDGMIRDGDNEDRCGHRSREGILIDGGPRTCESGAGAFAERNHVFNSQTYHITRSIKLRYARETEIATSVIHGVPSDEWPETDAVNIWIEASDDTWIHDNPEIANRGVRTAIKILGSQSCEAADSARTLIENSTINMIENGGVGIHFAHDAGSNGAPRDTAVSCSTIEGAWTGVVADWVDGNHVSLTDIVADTHGVTNNTAEPLTVGDSWWGDPSGPSGEGPGSGTSVSANVLYPGFLTSSARDDADVDGYSECQGDSDDTDPAVSPNDICDGNDNDLDGSIDEDFVPQDTSCGTGPCSRTGATFCSAGAVGDSCEPGQPLGPTDETCDNVDDDCDGSTDEEFPTTPRNCGVGVCERTGGTACVNGQVEDSCTPGDPLSPDDATCDGQDDNCNGASDEDFVPGPTSCGVGVCQSSGVSSCDGGVYNDTCVPGPPLNEVDDTCDGVDDDCDGTADDGYVVTPTSCGFGACARTGELVCEGGSAHDTCVPGTPAAPTDEICDGQDDDCDGSTDEDYTTTTTVCGIGTCARLGWLVCEDGDVVEDCTPGEPTTEICNGVDDDCDGSADNNIPVPFGPVDLALRTLTSKSTELTWAQPVPGPGALSDLLRGILGTLGAGYATSTERCLAAYYEGTTWLDKDTPLPGDGYWFLVRARNCAGISSYDSGDDAGLVGSRDPGIAASPNACP